MSGESVPDGSRTGKGTHCDEVGDVLCERLAIWRPFIKSGSQAGEEGQVFAAVRRDAPGVSVHVVTDRLHLGNQFAGGAGQDDIPVGKKVIRQDEAGAVRQVEPPLQRPDKFRILASVSGREHLTFFHPILVCVSPASGRIDERDKGESLARDLMQVFEGILDLPPEAVIRRIMDNNRDLLEPLEGVPYERFIAAKGGELLEGRQWKSHGASSGLMQR